MTSRYTKGAVRQYGRLS